MAKKGGMGKRKGGKFERDICNALSRFADPDSEEPLFWRSAMSGGRATVQNKRGKKNTKQLGDITAIDAKGAWLNECFIAECKHLKRLAIESFMLNKKGTLWSIWLDLKRLCKKHKRSPLLIAKQNNRPILLLTTERGAKKLETQGANVEPLITIHTNNPTLVFIFNKVFAHDVPMHSRHTSE